MREALRRREMRKNLQKKTRKNITENYVAFAPTDKEEMVMFSGPPFLQATDGVCWVWRERGASRGQQVQHTGRTMSDTRKQRCGADESMYVHSEQRRNTQSKPCHESTTFTLLPLRPQSHRGTQISSRGSEPLGLQVQGFCCPLQQRPDSGRVKPQSRGGGDGRMMLLSSLSVKMESGATPTSTVRTQNTTSQGGDPTVSHHKDRISNTAETPKNPCGKERQANVGPPGTVEVSKLHLYLPSSLCDDEDQDSETDEMRPAPQSDVKPNNLSSSQTSGDQPNSAAAAPQQTPSDDITPEDK